MAGFDSIVLLYYFLSQIICCSHVHLRFAFQSTKNLLCQFTGSLVTPLNSFSHEYAKDFVGVGFGNSLRFRELLQTPSLVLSGPGSPKGKNGCLESRLDLVSITLYYLGCSNSSDDVGS